MTQIDGKIYHDHGLEESILSKCLCYLRQSTDSLQSLSNYQGHFVQNSKKIFKSLFGSTEDPEELKTSWKRKMEVEESDSLTSHNTTKQQSSKLYGTGTKTEI